MGLVVGVAVGVVVVGFRLEGRFDALDTPGELVVVNIP